MSMRFRAFGLLLYGAAVVTACSGSDAITPAACVVGAVECDGQALRICVGDGASARFEQQELCSNDQFCDEQRGACNCQVGISRCVVEEGSECKDVGTAVERCVPGGGGLNFFDRESCDFGERCFVGENFCKVPDSCLAPGAAQCDGDEDTVLICGQQPNCEFGQIPQIICSEAGFSHCDDNGSFDGSNLGNFCVNECNVRGAPLVGSPCDPIEDDVLWCAVLICNGAGTELVPDHIGCKTSGSSCSQDRECASCSCINGFCLGDQAIHCPQLLVGFPECN